MIYKLIFILSLLATPLSTTDKPTDNSEDNDINVQIALLLDTSGSMSGLIEQAKAQLWNIANDITYYEKDGHETFFEIALYEYGKDDIPASEGYIRQLVPFTSDMDHLSEVLFSLRTNGGSEFCGQVIHKSLEELKWHQETDMKMIYIAGNESFAQGSFPYQQACKKAKDKNILINTIFCGNQREGIKLQWNTGAILGKGDYHNIDHNQVTVHIESPYDLEIIRLNNLLNDTYIYYGRKGYSLHENMRRQDKNSLEYGRANFVKRSAYKSKVQYKNDSWDLVDAYKKEKSVIKEASNLPERYSKISTEELEEEVIAKMNERKRLQEEIACLAKDRETYVAEIRKNQKGDGLGDTILNSLGKQMEVKGFRRKDK